jgi:acetylornithine deacetylase/succinyl-diaminopimelate desuccinylase-like protein
MISENLFKEATGLLSDYLKIDTTNPPGTEEAGAVFLKSVLEKEGIPAEIYQSAHGRGNLLSRLKGDGSKGPLLLLHHIDVVGAVEKDWKYPPFSGVVKEGSIWGRGALDCKGLGIMQLMAFILLKRERVPLKRDIIYLAVADEEVGGEYGAGWMAKRYPEEVKADFCLNEGGMGAIGMLGKGKRLYSLGFGEKGVMWLKVRARGKAGHGSMPHRENANDRLVRALAQILGHETPIQIGGGMREAFQEFGQGSISKSILIRLLVNEPVLNLFRKKLKAYPKINAILRNTMSLTNLRAGFKENVIPSESEAVLDCRLLPDTDPREFLSWVRGLVKEEAVEIEVIKEARSSQSPLKTEFFQAISEVVKTNTPGVDILPMVAAGFTDSRFFRELGSVAYGLIPAFFHPEEIEAMHGVDERITVESLGLGTKNICDIIKILNQ